MFALGCILSELYTFQPLFTTKKLDSYLKDRKVINILLDDIPYPER
jgi:hypothetical protein